MSDRSPKKHFRRFIQLILHNGNREGVSNWTATQADNQGQHSHRLNPRSRPSVVEQISHDRNPFRGDVGEGQPSNFD
jgi:hypothetical protein